MSEQQEPLEHPDQIWSQPQIDAAQKYLHSYSRRLFIERESGSRIDTFPYKIIEDIRARKLIKLTDFQIDGNLVETLPSLASLMVNDTFIERE